MPNNNTNTQDDCSKTISEECTNKIENSNGGGKFICFPEVETFPRRKGGHVCGDGFRAVRHLKYNRDLSFVLLRSN